MNRIISILSILAFALTASACVSETQSTEGTNVQLTGKYASLNNGSPEIIGLLTWLNGPEANFETLDKEVGLYRSAASNIVSHVRGFDGELGTIDDSPLKSLEELDAISGVGPKSITRILVFVESVGGVPQEIVEGHSLTEGQIIRILEVINHYSYEALDHHVGLNKRAAINLVEARPFANMAEVADVSYVGPSAIGSLLDYAVRRHPGDDDLLIEGVIFTPTQAVEVVMLANFASSDELDIAVGLDARAVTAIKSAPIGTIEELANASYVGRSALKKMRNYLPSWDIESIDTKQN
jgi:DNA uptake protein ComE-like DNA-binding protein